MAWEHWRVFQRLPSGAPEDAPRWLADAVRFCALHERQMQRLIDAELAAGLARPADRE
jgi:hypothetical protein